MVTNLKYFCSLFCSIFDKIAVLNNSEAEEHARHHGAIVRGNCASYSFSSHMPLTENNKVTLYYDGGCKILFHVKRITDTAANASPSKSAVSHFLCIYISG